MLSLRHLALDAHIDTGARYDGNNTIIEDVIFEIVQLKDKLEKEVDDIKSDYEFTQKIKNTKCQNFSNKFWRLTDEISTELFDEFSYSDAATTEGEVEWKEYFHCVYDVVIPDDGEIYNHHIWNMLPQPPNDLDNTHNCWPIIKSIRRKFEYLKIEGGKVDTLTDILNFQTNLGKDLLKMKKEIAEKNKILEYCYRVINWSMY